MSSGRYERESETGLLLRNFKNLCRVVLRVHKGRTGAKAKKNG